MQWAALFPHTDRVAPALKHAQVPLPRASLASPGPGPQAFYSRSWGAASARTQPGPFPFPTGVPQWEPRPRLGRTGSLAGFLVAQTASIFWQRKAGRRGSLISTGML